MMRNSIYQISYSKDLEIAWYIMRMVIADIVRRCEEYRCSNCPVSWECKNLPKFETITITFE